LSFLCLGLVEMRIADNYSFQSSPLIAGIPWVVYFATTRRPFALNVCAALLAFSCSWASLARTGTTLICLAFLIPLFVFWSRGPKIFLSLSLIFLSCVPCLVFRQHLRADRDAILAQFGGAKTSIDSHVVWHPIYLGFSFVPNSEVPEFNDAVAMHKVQSLDPSAAYLSPAYERVLRHEVFRIVTREPFLAIGNVLAKLGVVTLLAAFLLFPARRFLFAESERLWLDIAFVSAMGVSAMNGVLVVPKIPYLLTFCCLTNLYCLMAVGRATSLAAMHHDNPDIKMTGWLGFFVYLEGRARTLLGAPIHE
jgi:hypothetical protein